jgi:hypothetical protein
MCMSHASMTESCHLIWSGLCMIHAKHIDVAPPWTAILTVRMAQPLHKSCQMNFRDLKRSYLKINFRRVHSSVII